MQDRHNEYTTTTTNNNNNNNKISKLLMLAYFMQNTLLSILSKFTLLILVKVL